MPTVNIFIPAPKISPASASKFTWLNANHRLHWATKAKITKAWRKAACEATLSLEGNVTYDKRVRVTITFHKPRGGRYDAANLYPVTKACLDGVVDAKLLVDDSNEYVEGPDPRHGDPSKDRPGVMITIEEI